MLNKDKDEYIKSKLKKDNIISSEVNEIYKNCDCFKFATLSKVMLPMSMFFVISIICVSQFKTYGKTNIKIPNEQAEVINLEKEAVPKNVVNTMQKEKSDVFIKNPIIQIDDSNTRSSNENELIKAFITKDNKVAIQLKKQFIDLYNFNLQQDSIYEVTNIKKSIKDIFVAYINKLNYPYVFLIMQDGTVDYIEIINGEITGADSFEFNFVDKGQIQGLADIIELEQEKESQDEYNSYFYYVNAIKNDGTKKRIEIGKYNDMNTVSINQKKFKSSDGKSEYTINVDEGNYVQLSSIQDRVYYINDNCLHVLNLKSGEDKKIVTGASKIWIEDSTRIIVRLQDINTIHEQDYNIIFCENDVTESPIIDKQENESVIVNLKQDGSIDIQFKQNGICKIAKDKTYMKENIRYNVYSMGYGKVNTSGDTYYANAKLMDLNNIGIDNILCLTYVTNDNKVISIDLKKAIEKGLFKSPDAIYNVYTLSKDISNISIKDASVTLENNQDKLFKTYIVTYSDGTQEDFMSDIIVKKKGYSN